MGKRHWTRVGCIEAPLLYSVPEDPDVVTIEQTRRFDRKGPFFCSHCAVQTRHFFF